MVRSECGADVVRVGSRGDVELHRRDVEALWMLCAMMWLWYLVQSVGFVHGVYNCDGCSGVWIRY